jgi:uncharacterized protein
VSLPESAPPSRGAIGAADQDLSDGEFAELDALLAGIPEPLEPLDVVMLDGFLCGVVVQPTLLEPEAWLPYVFDAGGHRWGEAEPGPEQQRARTLILRRQAALNRSIAEFGTFDPFILEPEAEEPGDEVEETDPAESAAAPAAPVDLVGEALLPWVAGFEQAVHLFPGLVELDEPEVATTLDRHFRVLPDEEQAMAALAPRGRPLESIEAAIAEVVECVADLYELTLPLRYKVEAVRRSAPKVGRNDPCPCGSGRKFKQCHGAA